MSEPARKALQRKSAIAFGMALICGVFLLETSFAHRVAPSPASPYIWAALGIGAGVALALALNYRWRAGSSNQ